MKPKKILFLLASLGLLSASTKPMFANEILIAHAEVKKIVTVKYKPTKIEKVTEKKVLPNGAVKKIITNLKLCKKGPNNLPKHDPHFFFRLSRLVAKVIQNAKTSHDTFTFFFSSPRK